MLTSEELIARAQHAYPLERIEQLSAVAATRRSPQSIKYERQLDILSACVAAIPPIALFVAAAISNSADTALGALVVLCVNLFAWVGWMGLITPRQAQRAFPPAPAQPLSLTVTTELITHDNTIQTSAVVGDDTTVIETIPVTLDDDATVALAGRIKTRDEQAQRQLQERPIGDTHQLKERTQRISHNTDVVKSIFADNTKHISSGT